MSDVLLRLVSDRFICESENRHLHCPTISSVIVVPNLSTAAQSRHRYRIHIPDASWRVFCGVFDN